MLRAGGSSVWRQACRAHCRASVARFAAQADISKATEPDLSKVTEPDWDALNGLVHTDEGRREVNSMRSAFMEMRNAMAVPSGGKEKIDWEAYKAQGADPALVDLFRKDYENSKTPELDLSPVLERAKREFKPLLEQADELAAFCEKRIVEIDAELKSLDEQMEALETATIDEELAKDPKLAQEIDEEISQGSYY